MMEPLKELAGYVAPVLLDDGQIIRRFFKTLDEAKAACLQYEHDIRTKQSGGIMLPR